MARLDEYGSIVVVTWYDCHSDEQGWLLIEELQQAPAIVHSVGWLLPTDAGGNPDHVTLYQTRLEGTDQVDSVVHIPICMVKNVKVVGRC